MRYLVIASCEDARTGAEFKPGEEFLPEPEHDQAKRLIKAGCLRVIDSDAPILPVAEGEGILVTQLRSEIATLTDELITIRSDAGKSLEAMNGELISLRAAHDELTRQHSTVVAERDELLEGLSASSTTLDYEKDKLGDKPLKDASKDQLLVIAAYEEVNVPKGDRATEAELIKVIEAKRKVA